MSFPTLVLPRHGQARAKVERPCDTGHCGLRPNHLRLSGPDRRLARAPGTEWVVLAVVAILLLAFFGTVWFFLGR